MSVKKTENGVYVLPDVSQKCPADSSDGQFFRDCAGMYALSALSGLEYGDASDAVIEDLAQIYGTEFTASSFFLILVDRAVEQAADLTVARLRREVDRVFQPAVMPGYVFPVQENLMVLVRCPGKKAGALPAEKLEQLSRNLRMLCAETCIYVSELTDNLHFLRKECKDLAAERDYGGSGGDAIIYHRDAVRSEPRDVVSFDNLEEELARLMQKRDFFGAVTLLDEMVTEYAQQGMISLTNLKHELRFRLTQMRRLAHMGDVYSPEYQSAMDRVQRARNVTMLKQALYDIFAVMEDEILEQDQIQSNPKVVSIQKYIANSYSDPSLSASMLCDQFRLSPAYLSRIFKQETGHGVLDEIHGYRVRAARNLLENTSRSLDDIAKTVGFSSRGVLIRVFKEQEGLTPGSYRARNAN